MKKTYFAKVTDSMTWDTLKEKIEEQKRNKSKRLPYSVIAKINVTSKDFDELSLSIGKPNSLYYQYHEKSTATEMGVWNCILITCKDDPRNILIFTSGNIYPLYASIIL